MPPPFRAEHIGSLLRPRSLLDGFRRLGAGEIDASAYATLVDDAVRDVIRQQERIGLRAVTDGEFRRISYWSHFVDTIEGFAVRPSSYKFHDAEGRDYEFLSPYVERAIRRHRSPSAPAFTFAKSVAQQTIKITMPSPPTLHFWRGRQTLAPGSYESEEAYFADLVTVYRAEIAELAEMGARYIQFDEVPLAMLCDQGVRDTLAASGIDPDRLAQRYVRLIEDCTSGAPAGMVLGLHLCRGNFKGRWLAQGGYDRVAELMFAARNIAAYFLEYDNDRAGSFEPLHHLPAGKIAVLGLITSKTGVMEEIGDLTQRIERAARFTPLDRLAISPQCGFSSTIGGNPLTIDDQWRKLALVVDVARQVWGTA